MDGLCGACRRMLGPIRVFPSPIRVFLFVFVANTCVRCCSGHLLFCGRNEEERWLGYDRWQR